MEDEKKRTSKITSSWRVILSMFLFFKPQIITGLEQIVALTNYKIMGGKGTNEYKMREDVHLFQSQELYQNQEGLPDDCGITRQPLHWQCLGLLNFAVKYH